MTDRFDITRLALRGYRSIASCDAKLGPLTMLVGPNGSGKSNVLDALRFTAQALSETLDGAVRQRGGIEELLHFRPTQWVGFKTSIEFRSEQYTGHYAYAIERTGRGGFRVFSENIEVSSPGDSNDPTSASHYSVLDGEVIDSSETALPGVSSDRLLLVAASGLRQFRWVYEGLANIDIYNISPDVIRQPQAPDAGGVLRRDGSNLASVIERIRNERPHELEHIEAYLSQVLGAPVHVMGQNLGSWSTLTFRQDQQSASAPIWLRSSSMSDGTLRALGVLVALLANRSGADWPADTGWPVGIEEPEAALHPAAAGVLLDALRDASATRQILVTTHSPDLLDSPSITAEELLAVRMVAGTSVIGPVDAAGQKALRESLYTPGELLRVDQLLPAKPGPTPEDDG
jgi:predicted ATPase